MSDSTQSLLQVTISLRYTFDSLGCEVFKMKKQLALIFLICACPSYAVQTPTWASGMLQCQQGTCHNGNHSECACTEPECNKKGAHCQPMCSNVTPNCQPCAPCLGAATPLEKQAQQKSHEKSKQTVQLSLIQIN